MPGLGTEAGRQAHLVLAPLAEQQRIADKLDGLLARVDACRARLERVAGHPQALSPGGAGRGDGGEVDGGLAGGEA